MEKYYIIAGYGKYKYPKKVSSKEAKKQQDKGKKVYNSSSEAKEDM